MNEEKKFQMLMSRELTIDRAIDWKSDSRPIKEEEKEEKESM